MDKGTISFSPLGRDLWTYWSWSEVGFASLVPIGSYTDVRTYSKVSRFVQPLDVIYISIIQLYTPTPKKDSHKSSARCLQELLAERVVGVPLTLNRRIEGRPVIRVHLKPLL